MVYDIKTEKIGRQSSLENLVNLSANTSTDDKVVFAS